MLSVFLIRDLKVYWYLYGDICEFKPVTNSNFLHTVQIPCQAIIGEIWDFHGGENDNNILLGSGVV